MKLDRMTTGLAEETLFAGRLLDRCQVKPHVFAREEYKNVYSQFTHSGYSKAHKEATKAWLQSCMGQIATDVGQSCGLTPRQVKSTIKCFGLFNSCMTHRSIIQCCVKVSVRQQSWLY